METSTLVGGAAPGKRPTSEAPLTVNRSPGILKENKSLRYNVTGTCYTVSVHDFPLLTRTLCSGPELQHLAKQMPNIITLIY